MDTAEKRFVFPVGKCSEKLKMLNISTQTVAESHQLLSHTGKFPPE